MKSISISSLVLLSLVAGCNLNATITGNNPTPAPTQAANRNPIIQTFTSNPATSGTWSQVFTFNVTAYSAQNDVLAYSWSATGGTLSSVTGAVTSWTPPQKAGTYTVQVSVNDPTTGGQAIGTANITIDASGSVSVTH